MKLRHVGVALIAVTLVACSRGPDQEAVTADLQSHLDSSFQEGLFKVISVKPQGSAPLPGGGESRILVYFNSRIEFLQAYDLGSWGDVGLGSLAGVLGSAEKGIIGVTPGGNAQGDILDVYGRSTYRESDAGWEIVAGTPGAAAQGAPTLDNTAPPSDLQAMADEIGTRASGARGEQATIIEQELTAALRKINLRSDAANGTPALMSGALVGEYYAMGAALQQVLSKEGVELHNYDSAGSIENCEQVSSGVVPLALVQNDIAAMAYGGTGIFEGRAPMENLRGLGSLFPEPVQVVVTQASGIDSIAALRGKRVDVGAPGSGTRVNAVHVLEAHGIALSDLEEASERGLGDAVDALRAGELDALVTTIATPSRYLQALAAGEPIRILSVDADAMTTLLDSYPSYVRLTVPANTYPGQSEPADTVSVTAMLIARDDVGDETVEALLNGLFGSVGELARDNFQGARISKVTAREGVTIPLHPGAEKVLGGG